MKGVMWSRLLVCSDRRTITHDVDDVPHLSGSIRRGCHGDDESMM